MEKQTIAQVAVAVLQAAQQPMTSAEITQAMVERQLYPFSAKDPKSIVRGAMERRCVGLNRKDTATPTYFKKLPDGRYDLA